MMPFHSHWKDPCSMFELGLNAGLLHKSRIWVLLPPVMTRRLRSVSQAITLHSSLLFNEIKLWKMIKVAISSSSVATIFRKPVEAPHSFHNQPKCSFVCSWIGLQSALLDCVALQQNWGQVQLFFGFGTSTVVSLKQMMFFFIDYFHQDQWITPWEMDDNVEKCSILQC